jgi:Flp pilus assembly pilin Flp
MGQLMRKLWQDEGGALLSIEWAFVATILVVGVTTGLVAVRNAVNSELAEVANAFSALNQSYSFSGTQLSCGKGGHPSAWTAGSAAIDSSAAHQTIHNSNDHVQPSIIDSNPCN